MHYYFGNIEIDTDIVQWMNKILRFCQILLKKIILLKIMDGNGEMKVVVLSIIIIIVGQVWQYWKLILILYNGIGNIEIIINIVERVQYYWYWYIDIVKTIW